MLLSQNRRAFMAFSPAKIALLRVQAIALFITVGMTTSIHSQETSDRVPDCVIEELTFQVKPERIADFIRHDDEVWTATLSLQQGFLGKRVWISTNKPDEVRLIIRWQTRQDWYRVSKKLLAETNHKFREAMGGDQDFRWVSTDAIEQFTAPLQSSDRSTIVQLVDEQQKLRRDGQEVAIEYDYVYKKPKRYQAVSLKGFLKAAFDLKHVDTRKTQLIFDCTDGYQSTISLAKALNSDGWIAFEDLDAPAEVHWVKIGKKSPAPFYVVWRGLEPDKASTYPWPYAVEKLRLVNEDDFYQAAYPHQSKKALPGYQAFRKHCLRCHSINGVGGSMGVELNSPRNVTEYWKPKELRRFILSPSSFRLRSKMPSMKHVSSAELDDILLYLHEIVGQKHID